MLNSALDAPGSRGSPGGRCGIACRQVELEKTGYGAAASPHFWTQRRSRGHNPTRRRSAHFKTGTLSHSAILPSLTGEAGERSFDVPVAMRQAETIVKASECPRGRPVRPLGELPLS